MNVISERQARLLERVAKLPQWAQDYLKATHARAVEAERKLAEFKAGVEPTRIWYGDYDNRVYVPESNGYQTVHFNARGTDALDDDVQVRFGEDDALEINSGGPMVIEPTVSNLILIKRRR